MAPLKSRPSSSVKDAPLPRPCMSFKTRATVITFTIFGPLFLIYLCLRCGMSQCVLFQLPLVIPLHASAYFSTTATCIVLGFIFLMYLFSMTSTPVFPKYLNKGLSSSVQPALSTGFSSMISTSLLLVAIAYLKPDYIQVVHGEYLRLLTTTFLFCFLFSVGLALLTKFDLMHKEQDMCFPSAFFYGNNNSVKLSNVELKHFFYVHVGMVAWALLDLLILLHMALEHTVTAPLAFLAASQYLVVSHSLMYESYLRTRPFVQTEGLGFFWMMRVCMFQPFFLSLPVFFTATNEMTLPKPLLLADCVLFLFGFVIYVSSIHQKENYIANPNQHKNLKSIMSQNGRRLLASGYWGIVQKPDYLGYIIIWLSWTIACGFSGLSIIVLGGVYITLLIWLQETARYKRRQYGQAWLKYVNHVPKQVIPLIF